MVTAFSAASRQTASFPAKVRGAAASVPAARPCGQQEVDGPGAAVLSALGEDFLDLPGAVVDRYPAAEQAHASVSWCAARAPVRLLRRPHPDE